MLCGGSAARAEVFDYSIRRDGYRIGSYRFEVETRGEQRTVRVEMNVAVKILFVTVYRASHERRDLWLGDVLQSSEGTATYNGKRYQVGYRHDNGRGLLRVNTEEHELPGAVITLVPWRPAAPGSALMLNEKGRPDEVALTFEKKETLQLSNRAVSADKYRLAGRKPREVWYDADGTLVLARYENRGEMVDVVREMPSP